jgi:hypothetical protein
MSLVICGASTSDKPDTKLISKWDDMRKDGHYDCLGTPNHGEKVAVCIYAKENGVQ